LRVPFKALYSNGAPATGQEFNIKCSKNGGPFANIATANSDAVEIGSGWYYIPAGVAETAVQGPLIFLAHNPPNNIEDIDLVYEVVAYDEFATLDQQANAVWSQLIGDEGQTAGEVLWDVDEEADSIFEAVLAIGSSGATTTAVQVAGDNTSAPLLNVVFQGTQSGTYENTFRHNDLYHTFDATIGTGAIDVVYKFLLPGGTTPVNAFWHGFFTPNGATGNVTAFNFTANTWDDIMTMHGRTSNTAVSVNFALFPEYVGADETEHESTVYMRFTANGQPGAQIGTDQMYLTYADLTPSVGYAEGAVWLDTINGKTGTESYFDGTADQPVKTLAEALTIATNVGLRRIRVLNGSTVTLVSDMTHYSMLGKNWALLLNGQNIHGMYIDGATVLGSSGGVVDPGRQDTVTFKDCIIATSSVKNAMFVDCAFVGTVTFAANTQVNVMGGYDALPGTSDQPTFVMGGNVEFSARDWHGGIQINGLTTGASVSIDGFGRLIIGSTCTGGSIVVRGPFKLTDSVVGGFQGTVSDTERLAEDQSIATVSGALSSTAVDSIWAKTIETGVTALQAMRGLISTAWGRMRGAPNSPVIFRDTANTKDRITGTHDAYGNRTDVTVDLD
jgi:hypothetical protein